MKRVDIQVNKEQTQRVSSSPTIITDNTSIFNLYTHTSDKNLLDKYNNGKPFTKDDLISLYDIYNIGRIIGQDKEALVDIKKDREIVNDMSIIFDCSPNEITTSQEDLDQEPDRYVVFIGTFASKKFVKNYSRLRYITGHYLQHRYNDFSIFPSLEIIGGSASFEIVLSVEGLKSLKSIGGPAFFTNLKDAQSLSNLEIIGGSALFDSLKDSAGLNNLKYISGDAHFTGLEDATGLNNLKSIGGSAYFNSLIYSKGLDSLTEIGRYGFDRDARFFSLVEASHLSNLAYIGGDAYFDSLQSIEGLDKLFVQGYYYFPDLSQNKQETIKRRIRTKHKIVKTV